MAKVEGFECEEKKICLIKYKQVKFYILRPTVLLFNLSQLNVSFISSH